LVLWIPGVGPFALLSRFVKRLAGFYVPFLFMTVPVAVLFRLGEILGDSFGLSMGGIGAWLTAIVIPLVAVLAPLVLVWQAGGIFFIGDRVARRVSTQQAQARIAAARRGARETAQGGRNFIRGMRGRAAVRPSGQTVLESGGSRAHATGDRLNTAGSRLESVFTSERPGSGESTTEATSASNSASSTASNGPTSPATSTRQAAETQTQRDEGEGEATSEGVSKRPTRDFSNLRERGSLPPQPASTDDDDQPRYLN
jgi:type II secretory pathway pseudopilin PulG